VASRDLSRGFTFNAAAAAYDRFRPRYPRALFDDLADVYGVTGSSRILEVGPGPGVATEGLMALGWSVLGVEPGEHLAQMALDKFDGDRFAVEVSTFDDWDPRGRLFDVVFSAAAYHWVAPHVRWVKAAAVLDEGGVIALAGNRMVAEGSFHDFTEATRDRRESFGVDDERATPSREDLEVLIRDCGHDVGALWEALSPQGSSVVAGDLFEEPDVRLYPWSTTYATDEVLGLLATYSRFLALEESTREALFEQLRAVIDEHYGGELTLHYACVLAVAERSSRSFD